MSGAALARYSTGQVPESHADLAECLPIAALTAMTADGYPQTSVVWCDFDGACLRVNTTLERQKGCNLVANARVSLLIVDPNDTNRYLQIQGDVELISDGAIEQLDMLTRNCTRYPAFYGHEYQRRSKSPKPE